MALLDIRDLTIVFGGLRAVSGFNLQVEEGEVVGIIGPNGAGKTTVFNMISGIYRPTRGSIFFQGKNLIGLLPPQVSAAGIARTFQNLRLFSTMSVLDNIRVACHSRVRYGVKDSFLWSRKFKKEEVLIEEKARSLVEMFRLKGREHDPASALPYGEQKRLEMARALATEPKMLLLDEPAAGMNPNELRDLVELLKWVKERFEVTILLIEHRMDVVMTFCRRIVAMDFGEIIAEGSPEEIWNHPRVIEAYLGRGDEIGALRDRKFARKLRHDKGLERNLLPG